MAGPATCSCGSRVPVRGVDMRTATVLVVGLLLGSVVEVAGCGQAARPQPGRAGSSSCAGQRQVVRQALKRSHLRVDVTGDGRPDTVAASADPSAPKPCRGLVAVRTDGVVHSAHLIPAAVPVEGSRARVVGVPRLGSHRGAAIVVDTGAMVDAVLAQLFTFADGRLHVVRVPGRQDGAFIVEGGGVTFPHAARCTTDGRLVVSRAVQVRHGHRFRVTRRFYRLDAAGLRLSVLSVQQASLPVSRLDSRFPEFAGAHWQACTDRPGTS